jgi:hypothetical protein
MNHDVPAYGLWSLVIINAVVFILFAFSFFKPKTARDWRTFGTFSAFIVALFVEMYGFPLTIYLMSGWLARRFPGVDPLSHDFGHLWHSLLGFKGKSALEPDSHPEQCGDRGRLHPALLGLASALPGAEGWAACDRGPVRPRAAPAIRRVRRDHVRLPPAVANPRDARDVPNPGHGLRKACTAGGERRAQFGMAWDAYAGRTPVFILKLRRPRQAAAPHAS